MKKILLSFALISLLGTSAIAATRAYFSSSQVLGSNTFATGDVKFGSISGIPINMSNMGPGISQERNIDIEYKGSLKADIWLGVSGAAHDPTDKNYFGDVLWVKIINRATNEVIFDNWVKYLSADWYKLATDVNTNETKYFKATFTLASTTDNTKMGATNWDTVFKLYAVQTGGGKPAYAPYP